MRLRGAVRDAAFASEWCRLHQAPRRDVGRRARTL